MVLPPGRASRDEPDVFDRQPDGASITAKDSAMTRCLDDEVHRLVVPDRDVRTVPVDEVASDPRLGFGEGTGAGVVGVPRLADPSPAIGEVPIQVDAARVLPGACG